METISAYDAFIFGVCCGFGITIPIAVFLHFLWRALTYHDKKEINQR